MHYRCANAANNFRCKGSKNIARMQIFCLKVQKKTTTPLLMGSRQTTNHTKKDALQRLLWVTSGARTHDTRNHNPMLCQLSYSHHMRGALVEMFQSFKSFSTLNSETGCKGTTKNAHVQIF